MSDGAAAKSTLGAGWQPWDAAWQRALYGPDGFYRLPEGPAGHFRTAGHAAGRALAAALATLAVRNGCRAVVDIGAGRGELLTALAEVTPGLGPGDLELHGVDVVGRPAGLPERIGWSAGLDRLPDAVAHGALVVAWELLDVVPCPVLEVNDDGELRVVEVEPRWGRERLSGRPPTQEDLDWCARWWPLPAPEPGERVEVGHPRDALWAQLVALADDAVLLAVDYGHDCAGRPPTGSLSAFRAGRQVPPVPDGSCDITCEVAMDAVAAAGERAAATTLEVTNQAQALAELGCTAAELLDPGGLGSFAWLLQRRP